MSNRQRLANLTIAAVIAVVAIVLITRSGDDEGPADQAAGTPVPTATATESAGRPADTTTPEPTPEPTPAVVVENGRVVGGVADLRFKEGDRVRFSVTADVADHVHVHAYDVMKDVVPGKPVRFDFPADITGITEVELEDSGLEIAALRVDP